MSEKIYQMGIPRSGSSLVFAYLRELFPDRAVKTHLYQIDMPTVPTIVTVRDIRDVLVSYNRVINNQAQAVKLTPEAVYQGLNAVQNMVKEANACFINCHAKRILRYEDFRNQPDLIYDAIEDLLEMSRGTINEECRREVTCKFSLEAVKGQVQNLQKFEQLEGSGLFHGLHIDKGEIGAWRTCLTPEHAVFVHDMFEQYQRSFGYCRCGEYQTINRSWEI